MTFMCSELLSGKLVNPCLVSCVVCMAKIISHQVVPTKAFHYYIVPYSYNILVLQNVWVDSVEISLLHFRLDLVGACSNCSVAGTTL